MRVTNRMLHESSQRSLQATLGSMQRAQEQVITGRRITRPSDDPTDVTSAIKLQDGLDEVDQFLRNITTAERSLATAEAALDGATEVVQRAREIGVHAANGTLSAADRQRMAPEIEQLAKQLVALSSSRLGDQYVFSGFRTDTAPYGSPPAGSAAAGAYQGDAGTIVARVAPGVSVPVNVTADAAFGPALAALGQLHGELVAGAQVSGATIDAVDGGLEAVLAARATVGTRANRLEATRQSLDEIQLAGRRLLSDLVDIDLVEAVTELKQRETAYQAALAATSRLLGDTLFDYLR